MSMAETTPKANQTTSSHPSFPQRLYNVLQFCEDNDQEHILSWMNDATAFKVHDVEQFERELLPNNFNTQKYASFTRALCSYGFGCVSRGSHAGIYSHPQFIRNEPEAVSLIKRQKKAKTANNRGSTNRRHGSSLRHGEQSILLPSLPDNNRSRLNEDENESVFRQLYQTIRSQMTDGATYVLIRLPPGSQLISSDESDNDSSDGPITPSPSAVPSISYNMSSDNNRETLDQQNQQEHTDQNLDSIFDDYDDDFEPVPLPAHVSSQSTLDHFEDEASQSSMEPRSIQEMKRNPDDFNAFYNMLPLFPQPRYQALYDFSSPVVLPCLFYWMDISSFGMCWAMFLIVGHTIQALFTAFGPNTQDLVLSPKISMLKHVFMDIMWTHSLLSTMVLVPEYFGSSSVMLAITFISILPPFLATSLKTHYHNQKDVPFVHGEWWIADILRWIFAGYFIAMMCICLGHYSQIAFLKVIGTFALNLTPLFACESYRLLLSIPARLEAENGDKKYK
ncbi:unnamed protein product [Cylindrotheca closterium]|uniref:HSF-type DNA-binding domain-containing protein n=1 Tax=Cylindrotheca closterium TaxID=2856 RepID=A0AAD2G1P9_9STRA|nr:unnamed protein product [Cylindrotheca closterium]